MTHPRDMTAWDEIACQRGCAEHHTRRVHVDLAKPHGYTDLPQVPAHLAVSFVMEVWDTDRHPVDGGLYCPARDAVSETILSHGIWEPRETILALDACGGPGWGYMLDIGAHIGWFATAAAVGTGSDVVALDADGENLDLARRNASRNGVSHRESFGLCRFTEGSRLDWYEVEPRRGVRLVKIDIEGAEPYAVNAVLDAIPVERIDHWLIEVSPVFHDGYPAMLCQLMDAGYAAFTLPPKGELGLVGWRDLAPYRFDRDPHWAAMVAGWHQANVWLTRRDLL